MKSRWRVVKKKKVTESLPRPRPSASRLLLWRTTTSQTCYNLVNFLQRDEQDKQGRIDYLKSLAEGEAKEVRAHMCLGVAECLRDADERRFRVWLGSPPSLHPFDSPVSRLLTKLKFGRSSVRAVDCHLTPVYAQGIPKDS